MAQASDRYADLLRQGFMKPAKVTAAKARSLSEADWKRALGEAARKRYASYGADFFAGDLA